MVRLVENYHSFLLLERISKEGPAVSRDDLRNINSGYLLGICQNQRGSEISIIAVQTSTGEIIY